MTAHAVEVLTRQTVSRQSEPPFSGEKGELGGVESALALRWFEAKRGSIQAKQFEDDYNDDDDTDDVKDIVAHASYFESHQLPARIDQYVVESHEASTRGLRTKFAPSAAGIMEGVEAINNVIKKSIAGVRGPKRDSINECVLGSENRDVLLRVSRQALE